MRTLHGLSLIVALTLVGLGNAHAGVLYTVNANTDHLYSIDTNTLALSDIGALGVGFSFGGLAYDANSDTLFMVDGRGSDSLYTVNRTTGAASLVGSHGITDLFGLAFDSSNGVLYGGQFNTSAGLYTMNTGTGAASLVGNTSISNLGGLGYDSTRDMLVGMSDGSGDLYNIDRATGAAALLFNGTAVSDSGLAYDPDLDLFWDLDYNGDLRSYDPSNGYGQELQATFDGTTWDGLAYLASPSEVPIPAAAWLFGSALLGLGMVKRRKA